MMYFVILVEIKAGTILDKNKCLTGNVMLFAIKKNIHQTPNCGHLFVYVKSLVGLNLTY